jgi:lipopolysaccharide export system permease protein
MLRILDRYIFREIATTWLAVTAKGKLPKGAAMDVIGLSAVQYLTVLVPIGLFLSIMLALGRLYRDSEMPAMMACRVGPSGVYRPLVWLTLPLVLGVAWLAIDLGPRALQTVERIGAEARREADLASIEPGRFTVFGPSRAVVYGERVTADGVMENVFLQRFVEDDSGEANIVEVVIAERGEQVESDDPDIRFLVLHNGRRYEGVPGTPQFRVVEFVEHGIPYRLPSLEPPEPEPREMLVTTLMRSSDPLHRAELQWRIGVPLSTIILAIFAVPLSRSQPRSGRYGRLALGLLVFIIYFNLLSAAKAWVEKGEVDPALGLWWVHGLVLLAALILLAVQNQVHRRLFR